MSSLSPVQEIDPRTEARRTPGTGFFLGGCRSPRSRPSTVGGPPGALEAAAGLAVYVMSIRRICQNRRVANWTIEDKRCPITSLDDGGD
jgi:hypothetical protein